MTSIMAASLMACGGSNTAAVSTAAATEAAAETGSKEAAAKAATEAASADAGSKDGGKLVVYSPNSEGLMNATVPLFEEKTGIDVEVIQAGTGELIKRIQSEKADPYGDLMFGGSWSTVYGNKDLWEPYVSANDANVMDAYKNTCGFITGNVLDGSCIIINKNLIGDIKIEGYADLLNPALKGKIATADPANSSSAFAQLTNMLKAMGGYLHKYIPGSGITLKWFMDTFSDGQTAGAGSFAALDAKAALLPAGSDGLMAIGLLGGSEMPFNRELKGNWTGFSWNHRKEHFYRALLESYAYELAETIGSIRKMYPAYRKQIRIRIIGGGASSCVWPQGHIIGYEHTFVHAFYDFVKAIENGTRVTPDFSDGARIIRILNAAQVSAEEERKVRIDEIR